MSRWKKAQLVFLAAEVVGVLGEGAVLLVGDKEPLWVSCWGVVILIGLVGSCLCAWFPLLRNPPKK